MICPALPSEIVNRIFLPETQLLDKTSTGEVTPAEMKERKAKFLKSRKSKSETRIVGGVAIATSVANETPLSASSSTASLKNAATEGVSNSKVNLASLMLLFT